MPLLGIGGAKLYQSEMPGPFKDDKLTPRLADTSRTLWITYSLLGNELTSSITVAPVVVIPETPSNRASMNVKLSSESIHKGNALITENKIQNITIIINPSRVRN